MTIAVCLASYNGYEFIRLQIDSILAELGYSDILIISDDGSSDDTVKEVLSISDPRILLFQNSRNLGYVKNFEAAVARVDNAEYIFFSDQDDLWPSGRIKEMIASLRASNKNILFGSFDLIDGERYSKQTNPPLFASSRFTNLYRLFLGLPHFPYYGSTMVITREARSYLFPVPLFGISHDIWAALLGIIKDDIAYLPKVVTHRRLHQGNLTNPARTTYSKIKTRILWLIGLIIFLLRRL